MNKVFFSVAITLCFAIQLFAQAPKPQTIDKSDNNGFSQERLNRIDQVLQQYIDSNWIKGAVAYITHKGNIVYNKPFGVDNDKQMTSDVIFRIASQTKAVTSVAVMMLFEEGKFLLDDPISKYIPSFSKPQVLKSFHEKDSSYTTEPSKREITIRDLLTHTSGLGYAQIGSPQMKAIYAKAGIEAGFLPHKMLLSEAIDKLGKLPLEHQPGERWSYSLSIDVLGRLVEIASGLTLDNFLQTRLFAPLGMNDTYFSLPKHKQARLASVYTEDPAAHGLKLWDNKVFPGITIDYPINNNGYYAGGAGLVSTVKDYAVFLQMLLNGGHYNGYQILSRRTVEIMTMNQIGELSLGNNKFGLGFEITTNKGMGKLGQTEGSFAWGGFFGTSYWADPQEGIAALLFIQQYPFSHRELHDKFKALVYQALK